MKKHDFESTSKKNAKEDVYKRQESDKMGTHRYDEHRMQRKVHI